MDIVDPARTIISTWKWDEVRDWFSTFSGGQKQRVAMARLFYHRPLFAILDECTSAVSDEVEGKIYETCKQLGITLFTVSHRPQLKRYHEYTLRFDGRGNWEWTVVKPEEKEQVVAVKELTV
jgi:ATP-binding cassette subfamily D (ALD) protein 3